MADLSDLLGDVYGGLAPADPDGEPVVHEEPASRRQPPVPEWAGDERLDEVFADWTPGSGAPDAHKGDDTEHAVLEVEVGEPQAVAAPLDDDLAEALSAALASDPNETHDEIVVDPDPDVRLAPPAPSAGSLFGGIGGSVEEHAIADVADFTDDASLEPLPSRPWQREDDDILPGSRSGRGRTGRKGLRRR